MLSLVANSQFFRFLQQISTNLSILSRCKISVQIRLFVTFHLQTCYNLLKQLAASMWIKSFDNQLVTSLLTTCNRPVVNKLSQGIGTHPDISLLKTSLLQDVNRLVTTAYMLAYVCNCRTVPRDIYLYLNRCRCRLPA